MGVDLKVLGGQISDIKDADLVSMNDYISVYAQVEHLQSDYDPKLQKYNELYSVARKRDSDRGIFNVGRFHGKHHSETWGEHDGNHRPSASDQRTDEAGNCRDPCDGITPGARAGEILARAIRAPRGRGARAARAAARCRTGNAARRKSSIRPARSSSKIAGRFASSVFLQTFSTSWAVCRLTLMS